MPLQPWSQDHWKLYQTVEFCGTYHRMKFARNWSMSTLNTSQHFRLYFTILLKWGCFGWTKSFQSNQKWAKKFSKVYQPTSGSTVNFVTEWLQKFKFSHKLGVWMTEESMKTQQSNSRVQESTSSHLVLRCLFSYPTLKGICAQMSKHTSIYFIVQNLPWILIWQMNIRLSDHCGCSLVTIIKQKKWKKVQANINKFLGNLYSVSYVPWISTPHSEVALQCAI